MTKKTIVTPSPDVPSIVSDLRALQRQRVVTMKSRIMQANRLQSLVAGTLGCNASLPEKERKRLYKEATKVINQVVKGEITHPLQDVIRVTMQTTNVFIKLEENIEKEMVKLAKKLPVAAWVEKPEQNGFGIKSLAIVIGETGDLNNYPNPACVWARFGCRPYEYNGKVLMGATWKSGREGSLPADEWEKFGYSPRRRSIAYLIGENLQKLNFINNNGEGVIAEDDRETYITDDRDVTNDEAGECETDYSRVPGPYRARYEEARAVFYNHHCDHWRWKDCPRCKGHGNVEGKRCPTCGGCGKSCERAHLHGMLMAAKRLLRNLWIEWTGNDNGGWKKK